MKTLKKSKTKNVKKVFEILNVNELFLIRGGEEPTQGNGTYKDSDID